MARIPALILGCVILVMLMYLRPVSLIDEFMYPVRGNSLILFGSKSPYPTPKELNGPLENHKLLQIHVVARHGARYWTRSKHNQLFALAEYLRTNIDSSKFPGLVNLTVPFPRDSAGLLAPAGAVASYLFGQRIGTMYNITLQQAKVSKAYSSETDRAQATADAFFNGLFGRTIPYVVYPKAIDADLNPTYACKKYTTLGTLDKGDVEAHKWRSQYLSKLQQRLQNHLSIVLTEKQTLAMVELCVSQLSLLGFDVSGEICKLLTEADFLNYEIEDDVAKYQSIGYGSPFNSKITCSLLTGIVNEMKSLNHSAVFRFSHAETLTPLIISLGLFKGMKISGSMSLEELKDRAFITAKVTPFMVNLIFEVYQCSKDKHGKCLRVLLNEREIVVPGCTKLCPFGKFLHLMKDELNCNFDKRCRNDVPTKGGWRSDL